METCFEWAPSPAVNMREPSEVPSLSYIETKKWDTVNSESSFPRKASLMYRFMLRCILSCTGRFSVLLIFSIINECVWDRMKFLLSSLGVTFGHNESVEEQTAAFGLRRSIVQFNLCFFLHRFMWVQLGGSDGDLDAGGLQVQVLLWNQCLFPAFIPVLMY